jgi:hypothetical protein
MNPIFQYILSKQLDISIKKRKQIRDSFIEQYKTKK